MLRSQAVFLSNLPGVLKSIRRESAAWKQPVVGLFAQGMNAPFKVLISTVISLRTKDTVTEQASVRLFNLADNPEEMVRVLVNRIEEAIYPAGFYRTKARAILEISRLLIERHNGRVPQEQDALLALPGVGLKTANLTLALAFKKDAICVDTHVHRISNRWGLVKTSTPDETESALRKILPKKYWMSFNELLVSYGQNLCLPVSPRCSICKVRVYCPRRGVKSSR